MACMLAAPAHAAVVVDVDNLVLGNGPLEGVSPGSAQFGGQSTLFTATQTWTAQVTGTLAQLDLFGTVFGNTSLNGYVTIFDGLGTSLGTKAVPMSSVVANGVTSIDLSSLNAPTIAGEVLTLQLSGDPCGRDFCQLQWVNWTRFSDGQTSSGYAGGMLDGSAVEDLNFRTYVSVPTTDAVPDPATWALMLAGFGVVASAMRRRAPGLAIA